MSRADRVQFEVAMRTSNSVVALTYREVVHFFQRELWVLKGKYPGEKYNDAVQVCLSDVSKVCGYSVYWRRGAGSVYLLPLFKKDPTLASLSVKAIVKLVSKMPDEDASWDKNVLYFRVIEGFWVDNGVSVYNAYLVLNEYQPKGTELCFEGKTYTGVSEWRERLWAKEEKKVQTSKKTASYKEHVPGGGWASVPETSRRLKSALRIADKKIVVGEEKRTDSSLTAQDVDVCFSELDLKYLKNLASSGKVGICVLSTVENSSKFFATKVSMFTERSIRALGEDVEFCVVDLYDFIGNKALKTDFGGLKVIRVKSKSFANEKNAYYTVTAPKSKCETVLEFDRTPEDTSLSAMRLTRTQIAVKDPVSLMLDYSDYCALQNQGGLGLVTFDSAVPERVHPLGFPVRVGYRMLPCDEAIQGMYAAQGKEHWVVDISGSKSVHNNVGVSPIFVSDATRVVKTETNEVSLTGSLVSLSEEAKVALLAEMEKELTDVGEISLEEIIAILEEDTPESVNTLLEKKEGEVVFVYGDAGIEPVEVEPEKVPVPPRDKTSAESFTNTLVRKEQTEVVEEFDRDLQKMPVEYSTGYSSYGYVDTKFLSKECPKSESIRTYLERYLKELPAKVECDHFVEVGRRCNLDGIISGGDSRWLGKTCVPKLPVLCLSVTQKKVSTKVWEFLFGGTESETKENHRQFSRELTARRWWQSNQPRFHFYQGADPYVVVMVAVTVRHINLFDQKSCGTNAFLWDSFSVNFDFDKFLDYVKDTNEKASRTVWGMLGKIPLTDIPARKLIGRVFPRESVLIQC